MNNRYHQTDAQEKLKTDFQTKLDAILGRTLTARNINAYADDALYDLVVLVEEIVAGTRYIFPLSDIENERRALADASLDPDTIDQTLNHIANVAESTHRLDELIIKKAKFTDTVLVPPDAAKVAPIVAGDGSFEKPKECIPKLKTLLLLLETEFGIDLENDTELPPILEGPIHPGMVRSTTYKLVNIPSLNR